MSLEVGKAGLSSIEGELAALHHRAIDRSTTGAPLRAVKRQIAVGDSLMVLHQGYSCDVHLSLPQPLLDATSRFTYSKALSDYANRATRHLETKNGYKIVQKMNKFFAQTGTLNADGSPNIQRAKAIATLKDLTRSCNDAHVFFVNLEKEVEKSIEAETSALANQIEKLNKQHSSMKNSSSSARALQTSGYYDSLLGLSKIVGVNVPLSGVEEGNLPTQVNIKNATGGSVNVIGGADLKSTFQHALDSKKQNHIEEGKLAALQHLASHVIPEQRQHLESVFAQVKQLIPSVRYVEPSSKGNYVFGTISDDIAIANVSEDEKTTLINSANEALNRVAEMSSSFASKKDQLSEELKIAQSEREKLVKLSNLEYSTRVGELSLARDLIGRLLEFSQSFYRSIARIGSNNY